jgi:ABC-type polysaccharide/polyol phosphate export permease
MSTRTTTEMVAPPSTTLLGPPAPRRERLRDLTALTWTLSRKNFQVRYKRAVLGIVWAVLQPAFQAAVLSVVFIKVFKAGNGIEDFPVFGLSGMLPWTFFAQSLSVATVSVLDNGSLVKKVPVPLVVFPWSAIGGMALAFAAALPVLLVAGLAVGGIGWHVLLLPVALLLQALSVVGLATLTAGLYPAYRDIRYFVESSLIVGLYLSPVLYPPERLPDVAREVLRFNPLTGVLSLYRAAFLSRDVDWLSVGASFLVGVVLLYGGLRVFRRRSDEFADLV